MTGLYLHIPFCHKACVYCDFHFTTSLRYKDRLLEALYAELIQRAASKSVQVETIYFGGGTPSVLSASEIKSLLAVISKHYVVSDKAEITIEANPEDIDAQKVTKWIESGINRVSLGVQSFDDADLSWMNRGHTAEQSINAVKLLQQNGIHNISLDLIFGLPNQTIDNWKLSLEKLINLDVQHVSLYNLTVEPKTALAHQVKMLKVEVAKDILSAEQFALGQEILSNAGFEQYEISNYAKSGYVSKHNSSYWRSVHYIGVGPSAHSFDGKTRRWNIANNQSYMNSIERGLSYWESEELSNKERFNEYILTGLRSKWGCNLAYIKSEFGLDLILNKEIEKQIKLKTVLVHEGTLMLTKNGMLVADYISLKLFMD
jgi:oxygen-independent coproporphyrinogen III oxidase